MSAEPTTQPATPKKRYLLDAYYYGFDATGVDAIDAVLEAVALAGHGYHNTEDWNERNSRGTTPVEAIQTAANEAAASLRLSTDALAAAERDSKRLDLIEAWAIAYLADSLYTEDVVRVDQCRDEGLGDEDGPLLREFSVIGPKGVIGTILGRGPTLREAVDDAVRARASSPPEVPNHG